MCVNSGFVAALWILSLGAARQGGGGSVSTQGPSWGYLKVNSSETLSIFGDKCPQNGSKNEHRAPITSMGCPHIGPFVLMSKLLEAERAWNTPATLNFESLCQSEAQGCANPRVSVHPKS